MIQIFEIKIFEEFSKITSKNNINSKKTGAKNKVFSHSRSRSWLDARGKVPFRALIGRKKPFAIASGNLFRDFEAEKAFERITTPSLTRA